MFRSILLLVFAILIMPASARADAPKVVATVQPLHSLASMVMLGVGQPDLLVRGAVSEHGYTLKPSDARLLAKADVLLLVDPAYETFLSKSLQGRNVTGQLVWAAVPGIVTLPPRKGGAWDEDDHHGHSHSHHGQDEAHGLDGHLWLDPHNAGLFVRALADHLSRMDPQNAALYAANARAASEKLTQLDTQIRQIVQPIADRPFLVFHDAYHYMEQRYGLMGVGSVTIDPDRPPSAKRLAVLRDKVKGQRAACIFAEPQFPSPLVQTLAQSAGIRQGVLDPQGAGLTPGADLYPTLLLNLANSLRQCLQD